MKKLITDYMENGFLDNIIDMFRHDKELFTFLGDILEDERSRVRIGAAALVETFVAEDIKSMLTAVPGIAKALKNPNPTIRGDAAYLLGIIGHRDALPFLIEAVNDEHALVRETVLEAIETIKGSLR